MKNAYVTQVTSISFFFIKQQEFRFKWGKSRKQWIFFFLFFFCTCFVLKWANQRSGAQTAKKAVFFLINRMNEGTFYIKLYHIRKLISSRFPCVQCINVRLFFPIIFLFTFTVYFWIKRIQQFNWVIMFYELWLQYICRLNSLFRHTNTHRHTRELQHTIR